MYKRATSRHASRHIAEHMPRHQLCSIPAAPPYVLGGTELTGGARGLPVAAAAVAAAAVAGGTTGMGGWVKPTSAPADDSGLQAGAATA
jgi:hypothetical protein